MTQPGDFFGRGKLEFFFPTVVCIDYDYEHQRLSPCGRNPTILYPESTMCGRFTLRTPTAILATRFRLETMPELFPRYNVAPTQMSPVIRARPPEVVPLRWGLVPSWAKELKMGARMINARSETVAEKPSFRSAFRKRRCLVIADGYFEWLKVGKEKRPQYIRMHDDRPFAMAGLWERWFGPPDEKRTEPLETFTVLTTTANERTQDIHDRMPVILDDDDWELWLDDEMHDVRALQPLLKPYDSDGMQVDAVSKHVNNVRNDDSRCVRIERELF